MSFSRNAVASGSGSLFFAASENGDEDFDDSFNYGPANSDASSGLEDDGDAYVEENEGVLAEIETEPVRVSEDDAVFNRLAGYVARTRAGSVDDMGVTGAYFQEEMAAMDREELPQASKRAQRKQSRRAHKPNHEVQRLLGKANMAYIQQEHTEAIEGYLEVIRLDPHIQSAWTTLASIYEEQGNIDAGRQMRFFAAHIDEDAETWKELASEFKGLEQGAQSLYCLRKALKNDPVDIEVLWELASIYQANGQKNKAITAYQKIFKVNPATSFNFDLLMEIHPLMTSTSQLPFAAQSFRQAFDHHFSTQEAGTSTSTMSLQHILILIDLLLAIDDLEGATEVIKKGQRWLQGRKAERSWDSFDDDREYDPKGVLRDGEEETDNVHELDMELRYRLALTRLRLGDDEEASIHIETILDLDVQQYQRIFKDLGEALIQREMWEKALDCLALIQECEEIPDDPELVYSIGVCQYGMKEYTQAIESLRWGPSIAFVSKAEGNAEARLKLAAILEETGHKAEALEIVTEVLKGRSHREKKDKDKDKDTLTTRLSKAERQATQKLTKRVLESRAEETMSSLWLDVKTAEAGIESGDLGALDNFLHAAGTMIETYRLAKSNFGKSRGISRVVKRRKHVAGADLTSQALAMQNRLERVMGFEDETPLDQGSNYLVVRTTEFYGMGAEEWLSLTIKYCCVLMVKSEGEVAMDILEHVVWSGLFFNKRCEIALRLTIIACAMRMRQYEKITDNCKRLAQIHQFRPEPFLIMLRALGGGIKAQQAWAALPLQKFLHRELRIFDEAVGGYKMTYSVKAGRWTQIQKVGLSRRLGDDYGLGDGDEEDEEEEGVDG
ncbi:general transcription factor 3C polypeptide 3 (transcription factor C subunit 4), partial [Tremellales sp. Uapishka_1]